MVWKPRAVLRCRLSGRWEGWGEGEEFGDDVDCAVGRHFRVGGRGE